MAVSWHEGYFRPGSDKFVSWKKNSRPMMQL